MPTKSAARAEATKDTVSFAWNGVDYELVPTSEWDLSVLEAMEDGKITHILRGVIAGDGYARLSATKPKLAELTELFESIQAALGVQGN